MDKKEIVSSIKIRISELQIMEEGLLSALSKHASGKLIISSESGKNRYYQQIDEKKEYLGHQDTPLIIDLLQKRYESELLEEIRKEIKALSNSLYQGRLKFYHIQPSEILPV